jgi:hypothetical protein
MTEKLENLTKFVRTAESLIPEIAPKSREWLWVSLVIAVLFAFDLVTYNHYPAVWCDEVLFSEPAVNCVQHGTFTTTVWEYQPPNTFPVINCPLYPLALVPWLAATGTSLLAVRSFNYALMALSSFLLWVAAWRFGIVKMPKARLLMLGLFHFGYGMSFSFRCSRPDILGLICLLLLFLAFKIEHSRIRYCVLFILAALTVWIGLQVALFASLACAAACLLFRRTGLREILILSSGMAVGSGTLFLFLKWKGVLSYFLPIVIGFMGKHYAHSAHLTVSAKLFRVLRTTLSCYFEDFTTVLLTFGIVTTLALARSKLSTSTRSLMHYCLVLIFAVPAVFNVIGHYAFYYSYMLFIPALLALFAGYSEQSTLPSAESRFSLNPLIFGFIIAAIAVGLPLRLALTLSCGKLVSRTEIQRIVHSHINRHDIVFSDYATFFEVKNSADVVYVPFSSSALVTMASIGGYDFTPEEKQSISVLVIRPEQSGYLTNFFGGRWEPVTEPFGDVQDFRQLTQLPLIGRRLAHYATQPQTERYQVQVFRRLTDSPAQ